MHFRLKTALALGVSLIAAPALAQDAANVKIGFIGGLTGPIESLMPPIQKGAELAVSQVNGAGGLFGEGAKAELIVADDGCVDAARAANAGDQVVNTDNVVGIVGAMCSGATIAAANAAAIPAGVVMVSPASTSPALTSLDDKGLVFRTVPSDAYQGEVLAKALVDDGVKNVAVTYVNNDYGTAFAEAFGKAFEAAGGTVAVSQPHEDNRADYRPEIGSLASSGADTLVVLAYVDGSGGTIMRQALETGDFNAFAGGDGMVGASLASVAEGAEKLIMTRPGGGTAAGYAPFEAAAKAASLDPTATYASTSYDAAFALMLAIEKNGSSRQGLADALKSVVNAPGEVVLPGEWEKAKKLLAAGTDINYQGASGDLEFDENGDVPGTYDEVTVKDGQIVVVK